jgi:hypothetical protein
VFHLLLLRLWRMKDLVMMMLKVTLMRDIHMDLVPIMTHAGLRIVLLDVHLTISNLLRDAGYHYAPGQEVLLDGVGWCFL